MSGYFGTETQQRLQAQAEASSGFIEATPGAYQAGRTMGCDDPDRLGYERIDAFLDRDGVCGFRLIPVARADELRSRLTERDYRFDTWEVFVADRASALSASEAIVSRGLTATAPSRQPRMAISRTTPTAHHRHAWGGLVAVAESQRGKGLGNYINARMIVSLFRDLGATHIYELVSASNTASRRMVESCGLRHEAGLVCGLATPNDCARFTR